MKILYTPSGRAGEYANKGLACNPYRGCVHGCRYCYVPSIFHMRREDFNVSAAPVKDALKRLEIDCKQKYDEPIFLSFTTDLYQPFSKPADNISHEVLEIIKGSGNNARVLTKGYMPNEDLALLGPGDEVWVTLTLRDKDQSQLWEPRAMSPDIRIGTLKAAHNRGIKTGASCEPVIIPRQTIQCIKDAAPHLDLVKIGCSNHLARWNWPTDKWRQWVESIDWKSFGLEVLDLCKQLRIDYYIKEDLRRHIPEVALRMADEQLNVVAAAGRMPEPLPGMTALPARKSGD